MKIIFALALALTLSSNVIAHSGGTDANGCHMEHRTGSWHCH